MGSNLGPETGYAKGLRLFPGSLETNAGIAPQIIHMIASFPILSSSLLSNYHTIRCCVFRINKQINGKEINSVYTYECQVACSLNYCWLRFSMHLACHMHATCSTHLAALKYYVKSTNCENPHCKVPPNSPSLQSKYSPQTPHTQTAVDTGRGGGADEYNLVASLHLDFQT